MQKELTPLGLGNYTPVCTYICLQHIILLKNGIAREKAKFRKKFFKVLPSRFEVVIYIFSQFLTVVVFCHTDKKFAIKRLSFAVYPPPNVEKSPQIRQVMDLPYLGVGYTVKLTGYCPPVQVLVHRRRRFQAVPLPGLPKRPGWRPRFPPESGSAPRQSFAPLAHRRLFRLCCRS